MYDVPQPGDPLPRDHRLWAHLVGAAQEQALGDGQTADGAGLLGLSPTRLRLVNATGQALEPGHVVAIGTAKVDPTGGDADRNRFRHEPLCEAVLPEAGDGGSDPTRRRVAVVVEGCGPGETLAAVATSSGNAVVRTAPSGDTGADGSAKLLKAAAGSLVAQYTADDVAAFAVVAWRPSSADSFCLATLPGPAPKPPKELVRFRLTATLTLGGRAAATKLDATWAPTGETIQVVDPFRNPGRFEGRADYDGWCVARGTVAGSGGGVPAGTPEFDIVDMDGQARSVRVTLTSDLIVAGAAGDDTKPRGGAGATATATIDTDGYFLQGRQPPGGTLTVYDPSGLYPWALSGAKAIARWNDRERRYELVACQQVCQFQDVLLASNVCPTDANATVTDLDAMGHSPFNQSPTATPTVRNLYNLAGVAGTSAVIAYIPARQMWVLLQVMHRAASLVTDVRKYVTAVQTPVVCTGDCANSGSGCSCTVTTYNVTVQVRRATFSIMSCQVASSDWETV